MIAFIPVVFGIYLIIWAYFPGSPPTQWRKITIGMNRKEVYSILGYDSYLKHIEDYGFPRSEYWHDDEGYNMYRSQYMWAIHFQWNGFSKLAKADDIIPNNIKHLDDKLIVVEIIQNTESLIVFRPFPHIERVYHN